MADRDHPKTHVEDQVEKGQVDLPRKQPLSPLHEGIDPLTESDTMYGNDDNTNKDAEPEHLSLEEHLDPTNQPSVENPASSSSEPADDVDEELTPDEQLAADTKPGQADDATPDAGEQALPQEPHTDKGNTSPANRTKNTSTPKPRKG